MRTVVIWFEHLPTWSRHTLSGLAQAIPFYAAAVLSHNVSDVAKSAGIPGVLLHGTVFVLMLTVLLAVKAYADSVRRDQQREAESRRSTLERAHDLTDRIVSHTLAELDDARLPPSEINSALLYGATKQIMRIVRAAHEALEGAFGSRPEGGQVNFEVTFMTRSFRDQFITIPSWANRDGRSPQSMLLREKEPQVYERTVTAQVYSAQSPTPKVIEDTEAEEGYQALYEGQKRRIRSSIIYPVKSAANALLGTLVVHCEVPRFFKKADERYWSEFLEVFARLIAYEKGKMDRADRMRRDGATQTCVAVPPPPF